MSCSPTAMSKPGMNGVRGCVMNGDQLIIGNSQSPYILVVESEMPHNISKTFERRWGNDDFPSVLGDYNSFSDTSQEWYTPPSRCKPSKVSNSVLSRFCNCFCLSRWAAFHRKWRPLVSWFVYQVTMAVEINSLNGIGCSGFVCHQQMLHCTLSHLKTVIVTPFVTD